METYTLLTTILRLLLDGSLPRDTIVNNIVEILPKELQSRKDLLHAGTRELESLIGASAKKPILFDVADIWLRVCQSAGDDEVICYASVVKAKIALRLFAKQHEGFDNTAMLSIWEEAWYCCDKDRQKQASNVLDCRFWVIRFCFLIGDMEKRDLLLQDHLKQAEQLLNDETVALSIRARAWVHFFWASLNSASFYVRSDDYGSTGFDLFFEKYLYPYTQNSEFRRLLVEAITTGLGSKYEAEELYFMIALLRIGWGVIPIERVMEYYDRAAKIALNLDDGRYRDSSLFVAMHFAHYISVEYQRHDLGLRILLESKKQIKNQRLEREKKLAYYPRLNDLILQTLVRNGQIEQAQRMAKHGQSYLTNRGISFHLRFRVGISISDLFSRLGQYYKSYQILWNLSNEADSLGLPHYYYIALTNLAADLEAMGDRLSASALLKSVFEKIKTDLSLTRLRMHVLNSLCAIEGELGNVDKALDYGKESLSIAESVGDVRQQAACLGNLCQWYCKAGNRHEAMECLSRGVTIALNDPDKESLLFYCAEVAYLSVLTGDDRLLKQMQPYTLQLLKHGSNPYFRSMFHFHEGMRLASKKQYCEATQELLKSLKCSLDIRNDIKSFEYRLSYSSKTNAIFHHAIECYYRMLKHEHKGSSENLLVIFELAKFRVLGELQTIRRLDRNTTANSDQLFARADFAFVKTLDQLDPENLQASESDTIPSSEVASPVDSYFSFIPISFNEACQILRSF
jgi:tetratricopeptide (TPR) repeat protein